MSHFCILVHVACSKKGTDVSPIDLSRRRHVVGVAVEVMLCKLRQCNTLSNTTASHKKLHLFLPGAPRFSGYFFWLLQLFFLLLSQIRFFRTLILSSRLLKATVANDAA